MRLPIPHQLALLTATLVMPFWVNATLANSSDVVRIQGAPEYEELRQDLRTAYNVLNTNLQFCENRVPTEVNQCQVAHRVGVRTLNEAMDTITRREAEEYGDLYPGECTPQLDNTFYDPNANFCFTDHPAD